MVSLINQLEHEFLTAADASYAQWQKAYLKHQFQFIGLRKPIRTRIQKEIFKQLSISSQKELIDLIIYLWQKPQREFKHAAIDVSRKYEKLWNVEMLSLFEYMVRTHSWWDTVDTVAVHLIGKLVKKHPELNKTMDIWIVDDFMWIRRTALLHQLIVKKTIDREKLFEYCEKTMHEKEFFIRKAIGWVLREYSKIDKKTVADFLYKNQYTLSPLSKREGSKYL